MSHTVTQIQKMTCTPGEGVGGGHPLNLEALGLRWAEEIMHVGACARLSPHAHLSQQLAKIIQLLFERRVILLLSSSLHGRGSGGMSINPVQPTRFAKQHDWTEGSSSDDGHQHHPHQCTAAPERTQQKLKPGASSPCNCMPGFVTESCQSPCTCLSTSRCQCHGHWTRQCQQKACTPWPAHSRQ